jgi:hypothetical protein
MCPDGLGALHVQPTGCFKELQDVGLASQNDSQNDRQNDMNQ